MNPVDFSSLLTNKVLKERSRLLILSYLIASETNSGTFMSIQKALKLSRGNLSVHIKTLSEVGYVDVEKSFKNNIPQTLIIITKQGIITFKEYLKELEQIIDIAKS